jgi:hypothetical protein
MTLLTTALSWRLRPVIGKSSAFLTAFLVSTVLTLPVPAFSQVEWVGDTRSQAEARLPLSHRLSAGQALVNLARQMIGRPYTAFSLDRGPFERLRLDLTSFDCVLLVEQLLALIHSTSIHEFPSQVMRLRYSNSLPEYCKRNHYFSVWARNAEKQGFIDDISASLPGASTRTRSLTFMSSHPQAYRPMMRESLRQCIARLEQHLSVDQVYVPLSSLPAASSMLRSGDIFALVTDIHGLDVTHTGILERTGTELNAIHAIPVRGVVRTTDFIGYASRVDDVIGVSIYRPLSPLRQK